MAANEYVFPTYWTFTATCEEVFQILSDPMQLTRWWPEVYLGVSQAKPAGQDGMGAVYRLHTKGFLPYTLKWDLTVTGSERPNHLAIEASGDFVGTGVWILTQKGELTEVFYDWRISAEKPLLKHLSFLLKPVFSANHRWAMAKGEAALARELLRVRAS